MCIYILVKVLQRVHYGKYCTKGVVERLIYHEAEAECYICPETTPVCNISCSAALLSGILTG